MSVLPPGATPASHARCRLASELAARCPAALAHEMALTGSAARGVAGEQSDVELNCWVDVLPPEAARERWLREAGATHIVLDAEPIAGGSIWATCLYRGVWVEVGWQTIADLKAELGAILAGRTVDHDRLLLAWTVSRAAPLRGSGLLAEWQRRLFRYPDVVQDLHNVLRLLFALNRQWEPDWKWVGPATAGLPVKPDRLVERIGAVFSSPPGEGVAVCLRLVLDALALVPPPHDVDSAIAAVRDSLRANGL